MTTTDRELDASDRADPAPGTGLEPEPVPGPGLQPASPAALRVVDWKPDTAAAVAWNIAGLVLTVLGLVLFTAPVILASGAGSGTFAVGFVDVVIVVVLTVGLMAVHEGIHGLVMLVFGARPAFGVMLIGHLLPALFTTAAGHRFTRRQYLAIAAAPAVVISMIGFAAGFGPWGPYLILPLAIHFGGCVGDAAALLRTLQEAPTTICEDLRDGIRFHRVTPAG